MELLKLENLNFAYGKNNIISKFNLSVSKGEFVTLLGSSGCGKTTILRLVSGFLNPSSGSIFLNGELLNGVLPNKRKIGMVFQDYALFPHMTVRENLMYGLKFLKASKEEKRSFPELIKKTAESLNIDHLLDRLPSELSGGQQQRVALGRSLVLKPEVLLMDEPLSSLDTNLRIKVREELKEIQKALKITMIYVTHDQEEALFLSDKIAVMDEGKILQFDTPEKVYFEPDNRFVASFTGRANFISIDGAEYLVRPEWISFSEADGHEATVVSSQFLGEKRRYSLNFQNQIITVDVSCCEKILSDGEKIKLKFNIQRKML